MAVTTARRQVLAFRLRRQHLARRLGAARMADVTATCSVRNSPPGSAQVALLARVNGVSQDRVSAALSDRRLVEVHGPRMVPALVRPEDMAVFTVGGIGTDDASLRETLGKVTAGRLAEADIRPTDALNRVVEAAHAELAVDVVVVRALRLTTHSRGTVPATRCGRHLLRRAAFRPRGVLRPGRRVAGSGNSRGRVGSRARRGPRTAPAVSALLRARDTRRLRRLDQNRRRGCPATVHRARRRSAGGELGRPDGVQSCATTSTSCAAPGRRPACACCHPTTLTCPRATGPR